MPALPSLLFFVDKGWGCGAFRRVSGSSSTSAVRVLLVIDTVRR